MTVYSLKWIIKIFMKDDVMRGWQVTSVYVKVYSKSLTIPHHPKRNNHISDRYHIM